MHEYAIEIKGDGGEFCIGSISDAAAAHWSKASRDDLISYLCNPNGHPLEPSDEALQLENWHNLNDVVWVYGIEGFETLTVRDIEGNAVCEVHKRGLLRRAAVENQTVRDRASPHNGKPVVFCRSREKGTCLFSLVTNKPFKRSRLTFQTVKICGSVLITALEYDGELIPFEETFSRAYDDHSARIGMLEGLSVRPIVITN